MNVRHAAAVVAAAALLAGACEPARTAAGVAAARSRLEHRWLFVWSDLSAPSEVDRVIARLPRAHADGFNGLVVPSHVDAGRAPALRDAAAANGLDLVAIVMSGAADRNDVEGVPATDVPFLVNRGAATLRPDRSVGLLNGDFEASAGDHAAGWRQDGDGVTTFVDHATAHGGGASLRLDSARISWFHHARVTQQVTLQPHRQYHLSFWIKTVGLGAAAPEAAVRALDTLRPVSFQTFHVAPTQDWTRYDLVFNSFDATRVELSLATTAAVAGRLWWDDVQLEEVALVNVLRRPGCPVVVRGEDGTVYDEGRDYAPIADPALNPWQAYHPPPAIGIPAGSRIRDGERLRVSFYHSIVVDDDRVTVCLSEPRVFDAWRADVRLANDRLHPAAFLMSHDELHVVNQCALCRSRGLTAGQLLAWNVRQAAAIIRDLRPDAGIWVWSDMFDPMHNAVDHYYAANGTLRGSWEGLDPDVGVVNWFGGLEGRNATFFAERGLRQMLAGYYDADDTGEGIDEWLDRTARVPGIVGAMYTTWQDRYDAMDVWSSRAWGGGFFKHP